MPRQPNGDQPSTCRACCSPPVVSPRPAHVQRIAGNQVDPILWGPDLKDPRWAVRSKWPTACSCPATKVFGQNQFGRTKSGQTPGREYQSARNWNRPPGSAVGSRGVLKQRLGSFLVVVGRAPPAIKLCAGTRKWWWPDAWSVDPLGVLLALEVHASRPPPSGWRGRKGPSYWFKEVVDLGWLRMRSSSSGSSQYIAAITDRERAPRSASSSVADESAVRSVADIAASRSTASDRSPGSSSLRRNDHQRGRRAASTRARHSRRPLGPLKSVISPSDRLTDKP